jgi:subtilisin family serine protease
MAAARGIVVVNSMGNEGGSDWMYMIAPADGDSVISVGAVELDGDRVWFSSVGPTYDGRIKPDVMALGSNAYVATTADTDSYAHSSGTSFSCPITAGAVGLLLEGHPDWTPEDVIDALHSTGTRSTTPDTLMGWGIVQAYDAMYWEPLAVESEGVLTSPRLVWSAPNPFAGATEISFVVRERSPVSVEIYDVAGRLVRVLSRGERPPGSYGVRWDGRDASGRQAASGVYLCRVTGVGLGGTAKVVLLR